MKKFLNLITAFVFLFIGNELTFAQDSADKSAPDIIVNIVQDFLVEIPLTDPYKGYFAPVKAGETFSFTILVTNNRADTCTVSIDKSFMYMLESWVSIENNSQSILPSQTRTFLLTVNVPASAYDIDYLLGLSFNAYDKLGQNHTFGYASQTIIVDNSPPTAPTFTVSQKSTSISVDFWDSWDYRSNTYTLKNTSSGVGGIKSYTVTIKKPDGSKISISKYATDYNYYTFENLIPNTNYTTSVTAFDLVGYSTTTEKSSTTAPVKPSGLTFTNKTYISTTLSWTASAGATGYDIYKVTGTTNTKLNSSPVTGNSYTINNLSPNTPYSFNVIALSSVGPSDRSANAPVTTLALPLISGSAYVCYGGSSFSLASLVSGYSVSWISSSNISYSSSSGLSAVFLATNDGSGWIDATIMSPTGQILELDKKVVWVGKPQITSQVPIAYYPSGSYNPICLYQTYQTNMMVSGATGATWSRIAASPSNTSWHQTGNDVSLYFWAVNQTAVFRVSSTNTCGTTSYDFGFKCISCSTNPCGTVYTLAPNPATHKSTVIMTITAPCDDLMLSNSSSFDGHIAIYDNAGVLKKKINYTNFGNIELDLSGLKNGLHYVEIYDGKTIQNQTLLIQK